LLTGLGRRLPRADWGNAVAVPSWRRQYYPSDMVLLSEMFKFLGVGRGRGPSATRTESFIEMRRLA